MNGLTATCLVKIKKHRRFFQQWEKSITQEQEEV